MAAEARGNLYTLERQLIAGARQRGAHKPSASTEDDDARHAELMDAIAALRSEVQDLKADGVADIDAVTLQTEETVRLKVELQALYDAIHDTKREIAAFRPGDGEDDRILIVTNELDAVVGATEQATETILEASEGIEEVIGSMRLRMVADDDLTDLEHITDKVINIYEACNFQDITGQRITKVVNTLKFIEDRVRSMMEIWGGPKEFAGVEAAHGDDEHADEDAKLLNGPQLDEHRISQEDIDALFD